MPVPITLLVQGRARPGCRDDLLAVFAEHLGGRALADPAQRVVVWSADEGDPDAFTLFELYRDRARFDANGSEPWFAEYLAAAAPLLDGFPSMTLGVPGFVKAEGD